MMRRYVPLLASLPPKSANICLVLPAALYALPATLARLELLLFAPVPIPPVFAFALFTPVAFAVKPAVEDVEDNVEEDGAEAK